MKAANVVPIISLVIVAQTHAFSSPDYLSSLSQQQQQQQQKPPSRPTTTREYLNSLSSSDDDESESLSSPWSSNMQHDDEDGTTHYADEEAIPDEWYGKRNSMASWAGFHHPRWGGYLDNLSSVESVEAGREPGSLSVGDAATNDPQFSYTQDNEIGSSGEHAASDEPEDEDLANPVFRKGKESDYGDDVRWGAEVYLNSIAKRADFK
mmetsp:Transcript_17457/g.49303  ORF Transcript_17457/g.49303 Transcript_17457/m.49303 type:complete len:208 (+) Transcript_17457:1-624(+)